MFICEDKCLKLYDNWSLSRSYGKCEICGESATCADIPSKYLKRKVEVDPALQAFFRSFLEDYLHPAFQQDPNKETFTDDFGTTVGNVHRKDVCKPPCTIHSHSKHVLDDKPLLWRNDRGIFEHMCGHGIGHPCPDSLPKTDSGVHGCDGCCTEGGRYESKGTESWR